MSPACSLADKQGHTHARPLPGAWMGLWVTVVWEVRVSVIMVLRGSEASGLQAPPRQAALHASHAKGPRTASQPMTKCHVQVDSSCNAALMLSAACEACAPHTPRLSARRPGVPAYRHSPAPSRREKSDALLLGHEQRLPGSRQKSGTHKPLPSAGAAIPTRAE